MVDISHTRRAEEAVRIALIYNAVLIRICSFNLDICSRLFCIFCFSVRFTFDEGVSRTDEKRLERKEQPSWHSFRCARLNQDKDYSFNRAPNTYHRSGIITDKYEDMPVRTWGKHHNIRAWVNLTVRLSGELAIVVLRSSIHFKDYQARNYYLLWIDGQHSLWLQLQLELFQGSAEGAPQDVGWFCCEGSKRIARRRLHRRA